jgi:hypothetical protein
MLLDEEIGAFKFRVPKLVKKGWKIGRWTNPLTAGATLAAKAGQAVRKKRARGGLRGAYPELEGEEDVGEGEDLGFLKKLAKVAGGAAKFTGGFVPGPYGAALKVAGGALTGGKKAAPPPPCTLGQKIKRFLGQKPPCT